MNLARRFLLWLQRQSAVPWPRRGVLLRAAGCAVAADARVYAGLQVDGDSRLAIGRDAFINLNCYLQLNAPVTIGAAVSLADNVRILTATHEIGSHERRAGPLRSAAVSIGEGSWLGSGATVLPGVTVAAGCVIAAGSVVASDTEPDGLYAGVPATRVRDL
jgi:acetyltransferase-like isoleucine patch superfamily enzyme